MEKLESRRGDDDFFVFSYNTKILTRSYRTPKKDLLVINSHLVEIINILKDELLSKDQQIRRIRANVGSYGRFERFSVYIGKLFGKMKVSLKKLTGKYK